MQRLTRPRRQRLLLFTYPSNPDAWCEPVGYPIEGAWFVVEPADGILHMWGDGTLQPMPMGYFCRGVETEFSADPNDVDLRFVLKTDCEFDGTKDLATINFHTFLSAGSIISLTWLHLIDNTGTKQASIKLPLVAGIWQHWEIPLRTGAWTVDADFNWGRITAFRIHKFGFVSKFLCVDGLHFSYQELVRGTLTVDSVPQGKLYMIDSVSGVTPSPPYGVDPGVDNKITMDAVGFDHWENGSTANPRTIRLAEGEEKVIIAYYVTAPPPGKGKLVCTAYADSSSVAAQVEVVGVGTYTTPFELDLDPATYTLKATYQKQQKETTATIVEGKVTERTFKFIKEGAPGFDWGPIILVAGCIGAVIIISQL